MENPLCRPLIGKSRKKKKRRSLVRNESFGYLRGVYFITVVAATIALATEGML